MINAFAIRRVLGISVPGVVKSERRIVCLLFQNSCGVGVVELSVLFLVDDEMVQLCVTPAEYGQRFVPRKDGMFRRLGRVDLYQRRYTWLAFSLEDRICQSKYNMQREPSSGLSDLSPRFEALSTPYTPPTIVQIPDQPHTFPQAANDQARMSWPHP